MSTERSVMAQRQAPVRAADRAYTQVRDDILGGRHEPGSMLSENDLAASLSMSRTPVRAALARLQDEGWVTIYPQRGALVRELSDREVRESAAVRHALESAGIRRSDPVLRDEQAFGLAANVAEQEVALDEDDFARFTVLAMAFHRAFVAMAGNQVMLDVYDRLADQQRLSIARSSRRISGDPAQVLAEHRQLLDDAGRGDWTSFARHLDSHQDRSHGFESGLVER